MSSGAVDGDRFRLEETMKKPMEQIVVSQKSDPEHIRSWLEDRSPTHVVMADTSARAQECAQMVIQQNPGAKVT